MKGVGAALDAGSTRDFGHGEGLHRGGVCDAALVVGSGVPGAVAHVVDEDGLIAVLHVVDQLGCQRSAARGHAARGGAATRRAASRIATLATGSDGTAAAFT